MIYDTLYKNKEASKERNTNCQIFFKDRTNFDLNDDILGKKNLFMNINYQEEIKDTETFFGNRDYAYDTLEDNNEYIKKNNNKDNDNDAVLDNLLHQVDIFYKKNIAENVEENGTSSFNITSVSAEHCDAILNFKQEDLVEPSVYKVTRSVKDAEGLLKNDNTRQRKRKWWFLCCW